MSPLKISEIAQELDSGMTCYLHKVSHELICHLDEDDPCFDSEAFSEIMAKLDANPADYFEIEAMTGRAAFQVMEEFIEEVADPEIRRRLKRCLSGKRPFGYFKYWIEEFDLRQEWFAFKLAALVVWGKDQLKA